MPPHINAHDSFVTATEDDEDFTCPLCIEEMDMSDRNFKPCPCGYQVCQFCWNHIRTNLNGNCPACRRPYSEQTAEFKAISTEEYKQDKERTAKLRREQKMKEKEKEKKEGEQMSRKHLQNIRVIQKNLVYVIGLAPKISTDELLPILRSQDYFGQFGKIQKIVINKHKSSDNHQNHNIGVYVTYYNKDDASKTIETIDGSINEGRLLRASFGTTKYCTSYLRGLTCSNPTCMYLHEPGDEMDSYTREDLSTFQHAAKQGQSMHPSLVRSNATLVAVKSAKSNEILPAGITTALVQDPPPAHSPVGSVGQKSSAWMKPKATPSRPESPTPSLHAESPEKTTGSRPKGQPDSHYTASSPVNDRPGIMRQLTDNCFDQLLCTLVKGPLKTRLNSGLFSSDELRHLKSLSPLFTIDKNLVNSLKVAELERIRSNLADRLAVEAKKQGFDPFQPHGQLEADINNVSSKEESSYKRAAPIGYAIQSKAKSQAATAQASTTISPPGFTSLPSAERSPKASVENTVHTTSQYKDSLVVAKQSDKNQRREMEVQRRNVSRAVDEQAQSTSSIKRPNILSAEGPSDTRQAHQLSHTESGNFTSPVRASQRKTSPDKTKVAVLSSKGLKSSDRDKTKIDDRGLQNVKSNKINENVTEEHGYNSEINMDAPTKGLHDSSTMMRSKQVSAKPEISAKGYNLQITEQSKVESNAINTRLALSEEQAMMKKVLQELVPNLTSHPIFSTHSSHNTTFNFTDEELKEESSNNSTVFVDDIVELENRPIKEIEVELAKHKKEADGLEKRLEKMVKRNRKLALA